MKRSIIVAAVKEIAQRNRQHKVTPRAIVDAARDPGNPLHAQFEWDDSKAAESYRLWQARRLLATIQVFDVRTESPRPAYISLMNDRILPEGGYRLLDDVLSNTELRRQAVETALADLKALKFRYDHIRELSTVWAEVDRIEKRHVRKKQKAAKA
jgi:hypothetical protein